MKNRESQASNKILFKAIKILRFILRDISYRKIFCRKSQHPEFLLARYKVAGAGKLRKGQQDFKLVSSI